MSQNKRKLDSGCCRGTSQAAAQALEDLRQVGVHHP